MVDIIQTSFSAGEISPELSARVDLDKYKASAALMENFFTDYKGGAVNRSGTQLCGICTGTDRPYLYDSGVRVIPFIFSRTQTYTLVFTAGLVRIMSDGGWVTESSKLISGITQASPGVFTSTAHGYSVDDMVYIAGVVGMTEVNGRFYQIRSVPTANTFTLKTPVTAQTVNTGAYGAYVSGGVIVRVVSFTVPWTDLLGLRYVQSADVMTFFHQSTPVATITRNSHTSWTWANVTFAASITAPTNVALSSNIGGSGTDYTYQVTAISSIDGDESVASADESIDEDYWTGTKSISVSWDAVSDAQFYRIYRQPVVADRGTPGGALFGLIGATKGTTFHDQQLVADYSITPPINRNPFNATNKYPKTGAYHQQRLFFASTINQPNRVWATVVGSFDNMNRSIPPQDTDMLEFQLASLRIDPVENLLSMPGGILALTAGGIFHISGDGQNAPLTPNSIVANQQTYIGASTLAPIPIDFNVLYQTVDGKGIQNLVYNFFANSYESTELTDLAAHFFREYKIVDWAYSPEPWKIVWMVREDGALLSLTYYDKANVYAFAKHPTNGFVKSVAVVPEGNETVLYLAVVRPLTPRYESMTFGEQVICIERMKSRVIETIEDAWFADCGIASNVSLKLMAAQPSGIIGSVTVRSVSATFSSGDVGKIIRGGGGMGTITAYTDSTHVTAFFQRPITKYTKTEEGEIIPHFWNPQEWSVIEQFSTITGLDHLEGQQVSVLADGAPYINTVLNGSISLTEPASYAVIGLQRFDKLQTSRVELETSKMPTVQGKRMRVPSVHLRVYRSRGLEAGQDFDHMYPIKPRSSEPMGLPPMLFTGDAYELLDANWDDETGGQVCIAQNNMLPAQILGVIPEFEIGDN